MGMLIRAADHHVRVADGQVGVGDLGVGSPRPGHRGRVVQVRVVQPVNLAADGHLPVRLGEGEPDAVDDAVGLAAGATGPGQAGDDPDDVRPSRRLGVGPRAPRAGGWVAPPRPPAGAPTAAGRGTASPAATKPATSRLGKMRNGMAAAL
jgi:hypothetical protein